MQIEISGSINKKIEEFNYKANSLGVSEENKENIEDKVNILCKRIEICCQEYKLNVKK